MTTPIAICSLIAVAVIVFVLSVMHPSALGDDNAFLKDFVNHEFLGLLGVILAITLASAGQLHLHFNQMETRLRRPGLLAGTRSKVRQAAYFLIALFLAGLLIVVVKPLSAASPIYVSMFNGSAIFVVVWTVLILISLTEAAFAVGETISENNRNGG